jgi:hypothetical protein
MNLMGLDRFSYWTSWFITSSIYNFFIVIVILIVGYSCGFLFFLYCDVFILFFLFFIMGESIITSFMFFSTFLKSNVLTNVNSFFILFINCVFFFFWIDYLNIFLNLSTK